MCDKRHNRDASICISLSTPDGGWSRPLEGEVTLPFQRVKALYYTPPQDGGFVVFNDRSIE